MRVRCVAVCRKKRKRKKKKVKTPRVEISNKTLRESDKTTDQGATGVWLKEGLTTLKCVDARCVALLAHRA